MNILAEYLNPGPPATLFHYTSADSLYNILYSRTMWSTHVQYLNDSKEFHHGLGMIKTRLDTLLIGDHDFEAQTVFESVRNRLNGMAAKAYVISFSEVGDSLPQWRGYCPAGGYNIAVNTSLLVERAKPQGYRLLKCLYRREDQERLVNAFVDNLWEYFMGWRSNDPRENWILTGSYFDSPDHFAENFGVPWMHAIACMIKNPFFSEEVEWRLVIDQPKKDFFVKPRGTLLIPHSKFFFPSNPIDLNSEGAQIVRGVVIGPQPRPELAALGLEIFAEEKEWRNFYHCISDAPYRPL